MWYPGFWDNTWCGCCSSTGVSKHFQKLYSHCFFSIFLYSQTRLMSHHTSALQLEIWESDLPKQIISWYGENHSLPAGFKLVNYQPKWWSESWTSHLSATNKILGRIIGECERRETPVVLSVSLTNLFVELSHTGKEFRFLFQFISTSFNLVFKHLLYLLRDQGFPLFFFFSLICKRKM